MDTGQIVELISNIGVIAASIVAIVGVSAWKREFKGKRDMELAEDVLCLFYRAQSAITSIRYPVGYLEEGQIRKPDANETAEVKQARDRAYGVFKRIQDHGEVFAQLHTLRFRFMVRFGRDSAKSFDEMKRIVSEIWVSAQSLAQLWADQLRRGENTSQGTEEQTKKHEAVIWSMGDEDQIEPRVTGIIEQMEAVCRPLIEGQSSWLSQLWRKAFTRKGPAKP
jgi:hypothetical protein